MSSIYPKGRDGYYYYQTYVHNPDTGKIDKRIFHSLGTKDKVKAEKMQSELDIKYEKKEADPQKESIFSYLIQRKKTLVLFIAIVIIMIFFMDTFQSGITKSNKNSSHIMSLIQEDKENEKITEKNTIMDATSKPVQTTAQMDESPVISKTVFIAKPEKPKTTIPQHTIVRVERFSGAFDQGKVYVTVDKSSSKESMRLLCAKLRNNYKEFSNIIICLYADNPSGNELASGAKS